jgi:DNA-binding TFAR19-related protein (PDSD5 family)
MEDFDARADRILASLPDAVETLNEQTPEGILRAILAEVRGLREDLRLAQPDQAAAVNSYLARMTGDGLFCRAAIGEPPPETGVQNG